MQPTDTLPEIPSLSFSLAAGSTWSNLLCMPQTKFPMKLERARTTFGEVLLFGKPFIDSVTSFGDYLLWGHGSCLCLILWVLLLGLSKRSQIVCDLGMGVARN